MRAFLKKSLWKELFKKIKLIVIILFILKICNAADEQLLIPLAGDDQLQIGSIGDNELGLTIPNSEEIAAPTSSPGGGGGGGGTTKEKDIFTITQQAIKLLLPKEKDDTKTITIYNNGTTVLSLKLNIINVQNLVNLSEYYIKIPPKEEKTIELKILADKKMPGIYVGEIQAVSKTLVKVIPIIIEIESESPLFDILVEIPGKYMEIEEKENVVTKITLENKAVTGRNVNANITYFIKDFEGNELYKEEEMVSVEDVITYDKKFNVDLKAGDYLLGIKVDYENTTAVSSSTFKVIPKTVQGIKTKELAIYIGLIIILIVILVISMLNYKRIKNIIIKKPKINTKRGITKEKEKIIKNAYKQGLIKKK